MPQHIPPVADTLSARQQEIHVRGVPTSSCSTEIEFRHLGSFQAATFSTQKGPACMQPLPTLSAVRAARPHSPLIGWILQPSILSEASAVRFTRWFILRSVYPSATCCSAVRPVSACKCSSGDTLCSFLTLLRHCTESDRMLEIASMPLQSHSVSWRCCSAARPDSGRTMAPPRARPSGCRR